MRSLYASAIFLLIFAFAEAALSQNMTIRDFNEAKAKMNSHFSSGRTIYSDCPYHLKTVDIDACKYVPKHKYTKKGRINTRAFSLEWEHVVAAEFMYGPVYKGRGVKDFPVCRRSSMTRRECARLISETFKRAEADLYNLFPEIGELNGLRSNYQMAEIPGEKRAFGSVDAEIEGRKFEPRDEVKGDVARVYLYMNEAYPEFGIISRKNKDLFEAWSARDPVSPEEKKRAETIRKIQGNCNRFVLSCP